MPGIKGAEARSGDYLECRRGSDIILYSHLIYCNSFVHLRFAVD
jgi:hypothetical protein